MNWMQAAELWSESYKNAFKGAAFEFGADRIHVITSDPGDKFSLKGRIKAAEFLEHWASLLRTGEVKE